MQLEFRLYGGSLGLWRVRRTARRPLAVTPRGMECRCVARRNIEGSKIVQAKDCFSSSAKGHKIQDIKGECANKAAWKC